MIEEGTSRRHKHSLAEMRKALPVGPSESWKRGTRFPSDTDRRSLMQQRALLLIRQMDLGEKFHLRWRVRHCLRLSSMATARCFSGRNSNCRIHRNVVSLHADEYEMSECTCRHRPDGQRKASHLRPAANLARRRLSQYAEPPWQTQRHSMWRSRKRLGERAPGTLAARTFLLQVHIALLYQQHKCACPPSPDEKSDRFRPHAKRRGHAAPGHRTERACQQTRRRPSVFLVLQPYVARTMAPMTRSPLRRGEETFGLSSFLPSLLTLELGLCRTRVSAGKVVGPAETS